MARKPPSFKRCPSGKFRYRDRVGALVALSSVDRRGKTKNPAAKSRGEKRIYRCPQCGGWHLTSTS